VSNSYPVPEDEMSPFAALVLEVSDFLDQRPANATALFFKEQEVLKEGIRYLELAKTGQETVQRSGASVVSRDERLLAYEETSKALLWASSLPADPTSKRELFNTITKVLSALLGGRALGELDPYEVQQTRSFFRMMEDYYFSSRFSRPESMFDRSYSFEE